MRVQEDVCVGWFCTSVATTTGAELCLGGSGVGTGRRGQREWVPGKDRPLGAQRDESRQVCAGPCPHQPGMAGREKESEQQETRLGTLLPSLQLRQTPRALQNDEGIKPLFYLILWLRI